MPKLRFYEKYGKSTLFVFVIFLILVVLVGVEVLLRVAYGTDVLGKSYYAYKNDGRAFGLVPNYRDRLISPSGDFNVEIRINDFGIRDDRNIDSIRTTLKKKIMVLGDSFAFGYGLKYEEMFSTQLQNILQKEGKDYIVFSCGFDDGWSPIQYEYYLQKYYDFIKPDIVVLEIFPHNDIYDANKIITTQSNKKIIKQELKSFSIHQGYIIVDKSPVDWLKVQLHTRSLLYQRISKFRLIFRKLSNGFGYANFEGKPRSGDIGYKQTLESTVRISQFLKQKSVRFLLVSIPAPYKISERYYHRSEINLKTLTRLNQPEKFMKKYFSEKGIVFHDSSLFLRHSEDNNEPVLFENDWHFNPKGARVFAEFLRGLL